MTGCTVRIAGGVGIRAGVVAESSATVTGTSGIIGKSVSNSVGTLATGSTSLTSETPTVTSVAAGITALQTENTALKNLVLNFAQASGMLPWKITTIAYHNSTNNSLRYAFRIGTTWDIRTADSSSGSKPSLAFTPGGQPAIAYSGVVNNAVPKRFATFNGSNWQSNTLALDSSNTFGSGPSLDTPRRATCRRLYGFLSQQPPLRHPHPVRGALIRSLLAGLRR